MTGRTGTRTAEVMDAIRRRMASRTLSPGEKLPSIRSFAAITTGEYDHLPEAAFYMVGTIEEAVKKGETLKAAA